MTSWGAWFGMAMAWLRHTAADWLPQRRSTAIDEDTWVMYRAYAFGADDDWCEVPVRLLADLRDWQDVAEVRDPTRLEVRYVVRGKKYRMVVRPGDAGVRFPPYASARADCRLPRGVLDARLRGALGPEGGKDCNVTARVQKYQGPHGDFYRGLGLSVRVRDMFPFDDHEDNAARFAGVEILDGLARHATFDYGRNDPISMDGVPHLTAPA